MRLRRSVLSLLLLPTLLIVPGSAVLTGCGDKKTEAAATTTTGANAPATNAAPMSGDKVEVKTTTLGTGEGAKNGDLLAMRYTGRLKNGGTQFDSNAGEDKPPLNLVLGEGSVIPGWEEGLLGIKVGEKRTLTIPAAKGYGERGSGDKIPPNADLVFDVEALSIVPKGEQDVVLRSVTQPGTGKVAKEGSIVTFTYVGKLPGGKVFDDQSAKPLSIKLGSGRLDPVALETAMVGLKAGAKVELTMPPMVAFGPQGNRQGTVPGNSVVVFDIDLQKVE